MSAPRGKRSPGNEPTPDQLAGTPVCSEDERPVFPHRGGRTGKARGRKSKRGHGALTRPSIGGIPNADDLAGIPITAEGEEDVTVRARQPRQHHQHEPRRSARSSPRSSSRFRGYSRDRRSRCRRFEVRRRRFPGVASGRACRGDGGRAAFVGGGASGARAGHSGDAARTAMGLRRRFVVRCGGSRGSGRLAARARAGSEAAACPRHPGELGNA